MNLSIMLSVYACRICCLCIENTIGPKPEIEFIDLNLHQGHKYQASFSLITSLRIKAADVRMYLLTIGN